MNESNTLLEVRDVIEKLMMKLKFETSCNVDLYELLENAAEMANELAADCEAADA